MKKFVSLAMVAAMTTSMVPATAFAGDDFEATAKVVNVKKVRDEELKQKLIIDDKDAAPELQIKITDAATQSTSDVTSAEFTVALDGAEFTKDQADALVAGLKVVDDGDVIDEITAELVTEFEKDKNNKYTINEDEIDIRLKGLDKENLDAGYIIKMDLFSTLDKAKDAFVSVTSDDITISNDSEDMVYVDVQDEGITATVKKLATVAEEEVTALEKDLKIESNVGNFKAGQEIELKLSNGFEFAEDLAAGDNYTIVDGGKGEKTATIKVSKEVDEIIIKKAAMKIEAVSAKEGAVATLTVKATKGTSKDGFKATTTVEVAEVTDYKVVMSVDEDEDVPVFYSGVNSNNDGITDDADHIALEVTIKETFAGAWSMHKDFRLELPEGVYVTDVEVGDENGTLGDLEQAFKDAYQEADHKAFEFEKRTFEETNPDTDDEHEMTFKLTLVADPGFVGDVDLKLTGEALDEQEVTIATFATPYYVTAEQNDLKIDYRYTEVPSEIVIKEAEAGLWAENAWFQLEMEHASADFFEFEDATVTVDEESGMEIDDKVSESNGTIRVTVEEESDEAATITVSDMEMFMSRSIPAGPYDLDAATSLAVGYMNETLFAPDKYVDGEHDGIKEDKTLGYTHDCDECDEEVYVGCVADFSSTVKEAFINVVTAGREQDDASFTTKVVVPVGESYIVSGETTYELDVPAYVSEAGYTMLPVRAVAKALGINNNNVMWDGATKTVTILYGQRIITMVAGQKAINVNGSVIPASAAVEIVEGRTFLPMRDLATALGVTDIAWDASTKTATLNGGVVAE